jgi:two-component SAPR family response regulator|tara:strand:+ start:6955 stop:7299 length:345 start_codon:yes stop_codon:yes gene_type:complete
MSNLEEMTERFEYDIELLQESAFDGIEDEAREILRKNPDKLNVFMMGDGNWCFTTKAPYRDGEDVHTHTDTIELKKLGITELKEFIERWDDTLNLTTAVSMRFTANGQIKIEWL